MLLEAEPPEGRAGPGLAWLGSLPHYSHSPAAEVLRGTLLPLTAAGWELEE